MVEAVRLDALSVPRAQIARLMGVSPDTLRKRLKEVEGTPLSALSRGSVLVNAVNDDGRRADA